MLALFNACMQAIYAQIHRHVNDSGDVEKVVLEIAWEYKLYRTGRYLNL